MKHLYLAIEDAFAEQRAPKTLEDVEQWLMIQGHAEGPLAAPPRWIDHSKDTRARIERRAPISPIPMMDEEGVEEF